MNYTSIEQSKKLLELGLSPETADMYWKRSSVLNSKEKWIPRIINNLPILFDDDDIIPCWSLDALLEVMPKSLEDKANYYEITVYYSKPECEWYLGYITINMRRTFEVFHNISLIEAAFNMVVYLLENGYIKTEKK